LKKVLPGQMGGPDVLKEKTNRCKACKHFHPLTCTSKTHSKWPLNISPRYAFLALPKNATLKTIFYKRASYFPWWEYSGYCLGQSHIWALKTLAHTQMANTHINGIA
jgi:hypothetical protein